MTCNLERAGFVSWEEGEGHQRLLTPTFSSERYKAHWQYFK